MEELVNEGKIPVENINESCRRVLKLKFELGIFENPYTDEEAYKDIINCQEHLDRNLKLRENQLFSLKMTVFFLLIKINIKK